MKTQQENKLERIFSSQLEGLMKEGKVTQAELAAGTGVTQTSVSRWLKGAIPGGGELLAVAKFFHVSMETLLTGRGLAINVDTPPRPRSGVSEKTLRLAAQAAEMVVALQDELKKLA